MRHNRVRRSVQSREPKSIARRSATGDARSEVSRVAEVPELAYNLPDEKMLLSKRRRRRETNTRDKIGRLTRKAVPGDSEGMETAIAITHCCRNAARSSQCVPRSSQANFPISTLVPAGPRVYKQTYLFCRSRPGDRPLDFGDVAQVFRRKCRRTDFTHESSAIGT